VTQPGPGGQSSESGLGGQDALVPALTENADALKLTWEVRPATVIAIEFGSASVRFDGDDTEEVRAACLVDNVYPTDRVMVMKVPPAACYVIGFAAAIDFGKRLTRCTTQTDNSSNTTFVTPTGMASIPLRVDKNYYVDCAMLYSTAATTTGIQFQLTYTGTVKDSNFIGWIQGSAITTYSRVFPEVNQAAGWASADTVASVVTARVSGYIMAATEGLLTVQFRSEVSGSAASVRPQSYLMVERTAVLTT